MSGNVNKYKKYFIIIVPILLTAVIVELILLLKPNNELKSNQVKPNYDDIKLGDSTILFDSANVNYNNSNSGLTSTKVQNAIDELYGLSNTCQTNLAACQAQIPQTCSNSPFHLGDYISMTPSGAAFKPDSTYTNWTQTDQITPSELNLWRVIRINSDCTVEVVSEYVSSKTVYFSGKIGYQNYVYYLNEIAKKYANTTYTLNPSTAPDGAFRNVGYDGQTKQITNTTRLDDTTLGTASGAWYQKTTPMNGEESLGGGDQGYTTDIKLLDDAGVSIVAYKVSTTTPTSYWLASREFAWSGASVWYFEARFMYDASVSGKQLYYSFGSSFNEATFYYAVRPIITLKSGLTKASGNGTASSPIQLSAS